MLAPLPEPKKFGDMTEEEFRELYEELNDGNDALSPLALWIDTFVVDYDVGACERITEKTGFGDTYTRYRRAVFIDGMNGKFVGTFTSGSTSGPNIGTYLECIMLDLSCLEDPEGADVDAKTLLAIMEEDKGLRAALGDYAVDQLMEIYYD